MFVGGVFITGIIEQHIASITDYGCAILTHLVNIYENIPPSLSKYKMYVNCSKTKEQFV